MKTLWKGRCDGAHRRRNDSQGCNTIEQAGKKVTKEVDRESRRAVESQGGTTITVGAVPPLARSISPESSPESGLPSLPRLDDLSTLRCLDYQIGSLAPRRWTTTTTTTTTLSACFGSPPVKPISGLPFDPPPSYNHLVMPLEAQPWIPMKSTFSPSTSPPRCCSA
jgi:hypothetical protein